MPQGGSTLFGGDLKESQVNVLRAGIPLFQLIYPSIARWGEKMFGPFNVRVDVLDRDGVGRLKPLLSTKWFLGGDAYISFERIDRQTAVAWMPDDPAWHNRLFLMDTKNMVQTVAQERLPNNNIKTGAEIKMEIDCLEEELKETAPVWNIMEGSRTVGSLPTEQAVKDWIKERNAVDVKYNPADGKMITIPKTKRNYTYVEVKKKVYKKNIVDLRQREKGKHRFGWTECSYFQDRIKEDVIERIKSKRESLDPGAQTSIADAVKVFANMNPKDKAQFLEAIHGTSTGPQGVPGRAKNPAQEEVIT